MPHFGQPVDDYPNRVVAIRDWQSCYEVHRYVPPRTFGPWQGVQDAVRCGSRCLRSLTNMAVRYESFDILPQRGPEVTSSDEVESLRSPGVSSGGDVVVALDDS
jgi:hypothetical protein